MLNVQQHEKYLFVCFENGGKYATEAERLLKANDTAYDDENLMRLLLKIFAGCRI